MNKRRFVAQSLLLLLVVAASAMPSFGDSYAITFSPTAGTSTPTPTGFLDYNPLTQTFVDISVSWEGLTWFGFQPFNPLPPGSFAPGTSGTYFAATLQEFFQFVETPDGTFVVSMAAIGVPPVSGFSQSGAYSISTTPTLEPASLSLIFSGLLSLGLFAAANRYRGNRLATGG